jgi:Heparinase II/III-like protein
MKHLKIAAATVLALCASTFARAAHVDIIPSGEKIMKDRPRLLLRSKDTPHAISLGQLKALKRDADFQQALTTLKGRERAESQALVWLLTGDEAAADKAIKRLKNYKTVTKKIPPRHAFDVFYGLRELALAYDWLYDHPKFTKELKAEVRDMAFILIDKWGMKEGDDHVFHNYTWMNNSGMALWAMACYGDDPRAEKLMEVVRSRFRERMFPSMEHLNGQAGDAMGYWFHHCTVSCIWTLLAVQSSFEVDLMKPIKEKQNDWFNRQLESMIQGTLPDMRFIPWGDMQQGPNGGVTQEIAGIADAATWMLKSKQGMHFNKWLAGKRNVKKRFLDETAILYFLYTRHLKTESAPPPLAMLAGGKHSAQVMMRSSWKDDATVIGFRSTDYYMCHFHYDVGSFVIYHKGLLAVDAGRYTNVYGHQAQTKSHNTLLLGGQPQRSVRGQWYKDMAHFNRGREDTRGGRRLETGDMPFYKHAGTWTAAAGQFAQAYAANTVKSCVRQLLYLRPNTVVIVDNLVAAPGKKVPKITWMLHVPSKKHRQPVKLPKIGDGLVTVVTEKSWMRCRDLLSDRKPVVEESHFTQLEGNRKQLTGISRVNFIYPEQADSTTLVHLIEVGDGQPGAAQEIKPRITAGAVELTIAGKTFVFSRNAPFTVSEKK